MKRVFLSLALLVLTTIAFSQSTGYIRNDTTIVTNLTKTATLVYQNATRNNGWYLKDVGNGKLQFVRMQITDVNHLQDSITSRVPYTGAISNVNLGSKVLFAGQLNSIGGVFGGGSSRNNTTIAANAATPYYQPSDFGILNGGVGMGDKNGDYQASGIYNYTNGSSVDNVGISTPNDIAFVTSSGEKLRLKANGVLQGANYYGTLYTGNSYVQKTYVDAAISGSAITALTGDVTATGPGSVAATLKTVNSNIGTFGSPSLTPTFTVNSKGLIVSASNTTIQIPESQVTNLVSDLANKTDKIYADTAYLKHYNPAFTGTMSASGNIILTGNMIERIIGTEANGGAIRFYGNTFDTTGRGLQLGRWSNAGPTRVFKSGIDVQESGNTDRTVVRLRDTVKALGPLFAPIIYQNGNQVLDRTNIESTLANDGKLPTGAAVTAALGGYIPTTRSILNGYGISGGTSLAADITKSVDTTVISSKGYLQAYTYTKAQTGANFLSLATPNQTVTQKPNFTGGISSGLTSSNTQIVASITEKANGEQFYAPSGEAIYGQGLAVVESQSGGTGNDFSPSNTVTGLKFTTSASASFLQGVTLRIKTSGTLNTLSSVTVNLYADNGSGAPTGGQISTGIAYAGQLSTSYTAYDFTLQNVGTAVAPSTTYWVIITRNESGGGHFVFDSQSGTGTTFQGASTASLSEANVQLSNIVYARSAYGGHFFAPYSHGVWGTSYTGVGVRGDSKDHYGVYGNAGSGDGVGGSSVYGNGVSGNSVNTTGGAFTTANTFGYPALLGRNSAGYLALYASGLSLYDQAARSNSNVFQTYTQANHTGGIANGLLWTGGTLTGQTASNEVTDINYNLSNALTHATGNYSSQRAFRIQGRTLGFVGASVIDTATTLDVIAQIPGTNATITNNYVANLHGNVRVGGRMEATITGKANGEQYYAKSGESVYGEGLPVIESQSGGLGTDYTVSATVIGIKFQASATASFIQGIALRLKSTGALTALSSITVSLYADNGSGTPTGSPISTSILLGSRVGASYNTYNLLLQNVITPLTPSATYWAIITNSSSGGSFVLNSQVGTGTTFSGASIGALSESNVQVSNVVYARNDYGGHFVGNYSHGIWATSLSGIGGRFDSTSGYGVLGASTDNNGVEGTSANSVGVEGTSVSNVGGHFTTASTVGFPALRADGTLAAYLNGSSTFVQSATSSSNTFISMTQGNHTNNLSTGFFYKGGILFNTAPLETPDVTFDLSNIVTHATGATTQQRAFRILGRTYAFTGGTSTITTASTLDVTKPIAGTNATITNNYAINAHGGVNIDEVLSVGQKPVGTVATDSILVAIGGTNKVGAVATTTFLKNPMTTLGDIIYGGALGVQTRLAGNTASTRGFLVSQGSGGVATAPVYYDLFNTANVFNATQVINGNVLGQIGIFAGVNISSGGSVGWTDGTYSTTLYQASGLTAANSLTMPKLTGTLAITGETDNVLSKTASYSIVSGDFVSGKKSTLDLYVDATAGGVTITLPSAVTFAGYTIYITKTDASANVVTINTVTGSNTLTAQDQSRQFNSNATVWRNH